jgi:hypothetical protein
MGEAMVMTEICGKDAKGKPIYAGDPVKVVQTDPAHENEKEFSFCWQGNSGIVIGPFYNNSVLVEFGIPGKGIKRMGILSKCLKVITE